MQMLHIHFNIGCGDVWKELSHVFAAARVRPCSRAR